MYKLTITLSIVIIVIIVLIILVILIPKLLTSKKKEIVELPKVAESDKTKVEELKPVITESKNVIESITESVFLTQGFSNTTGESEQYQKKLQEPKWIEIRNNILARDKHVCQHCRNCIEDIVLLNSISELLPYTEYSQSLYNFIYDIFHKKGIFD